MMITCKTVDCPMGVEKHTPHPEGLIVFCGCCGVEMTADEPTVDEAAVEVVIENE